MTMPALSGARLAGLVGDIVGDGPVYQRLADRLRHLIADGRVLPGTRLPSEREATSALRVSRTTITAAYAGLREGGYLESRRGSGWVTRLPDGPGRAVGRGLAPADAADGAIDLTVAATRAPAGTAEAYEAAVAELPRYLAGTGYQTHGLPELREAIAERFTERGLPTTSAQIVVTTGVVAGITALAAATMRAGDRVLVESPGYPNTALGLQRLGARLVPTPVDARGWHLDLMASVLASARPHAAALIPDFQNPTGAHMDAATREEVAALLRSHRVRPIIDETIAEIRLDDDEPVPPFAAYAPEAVTVGGASKSHWGGLRIGWVRATPELVRQVVAARVGLDLGTPVLEQLVLLHLLQQPGHGIEDRLRTAREARAATMTALREHCPEVEVVQPRGGLTLWLRLPHPNAEQVVDAAEAEGLYLAGGTRFAVSGRLDHYLRFPYVLTPTEQGEAVARLRRALDSAGEGRPRSTSARRPPIIA